MESKKSKLIEILVEEYHDSLYAYIFCQTKNASIADDIVQEVYLTLCEQSIETLEKSPKTIKKFIFTIGKHKMIDLLRKNLTIRTYITNKIYKALGYELKVLSNLEYEYVIKELNERMDNNLVEILVLNAERYSAKEIGDLLNKTESNARTTLHRARKKAKEIIEGLYAKK